LDITTKICCYIAFLVHLSKTSKLRMNQGVK
jgi:hypothetical protein